MAPRTNKSRRNERRVGGFAGISNAILQFDVYLICRNSYNSSTVNMLFIEIVGAIRRGGTERTGRAGKMLQCTSDVSEFAVAKLQYHENDRSSWDGPMERRAAEERSFPPAVRSSNNSLLIICIIWAEIDTVRNKIMEIITRRKDDLALEICWPNRGSRGIPAMTNILNETKIQCKFHRNL